VKKSFAFCAGVLFLSAVCLWAQSTAQISGRVTDATSAAVPGAEVKATQTATGQIRTVETGVDGGYVLASMPVGPYRVEISKQGFSTFVQTGLELQVSTNPTVDAVLKVGAVTEQVQVEANVTQVETQSTSIGQVIDNKRVLEMPLNGRNPLELVVLAGMANLPGNGAINNVRNYPTIVISVAGGQGGNTAMYNLDGALHEDPYNNLNLPLPFPDALQEFKLETSALPPQYGFHSGGAVNAITKSGTNQFHGDLFEFLRNGNLNARNFFAPRRDTLKRNQFGGVIGGPVIKDKVFFFGGYQRTSQRSDPGALTAFVPTQTMLGGDFTALASGACQQNRPVTLSAAQGFVGNVLPATRLNSVALNIAKTIPPSADPCGRVQYGYVDNQDEDLVALRGDWQVSDKHTVFARYVSGNLNVASSFDGKNPITINQYGVHDFNYSVALGSTYLITNAIVNSFRIAASRTTVVKLDDKYGSLKDFGANVTEVGGKVLFANVTGGGGFTIGSTAAVPGKAYTGPNWSLSDDVSWSKNSHQIQFGGTAYRRVMNYWSGVNAVGSINFNGTVTGLGLADFLTGNAVSFNQGTNYGMRLRQYYYALYVQDSWKLTRNFTLNYGLRWEPYLSNENITGQVNHFDQALFDRGFQSKVMLNAPKGLAFAGDPEYACGNKYNCDSWAKFFPRVGFAWDPTGRGKMTIRAAYGLFGDRLHQFFPNQMSFGPPNGNSVTLANVNLSNPWANYPGGDPVPRLVGYNPTLVHASPNAEFPTSGAYVRFNQEDYKPMYVHQWNLSVQRQIKTWLLTANYIGNSSIHLGTSEPGNPAKFLGLGACTLQIADPSGTVTPRSFTTCSTTANQNQRRLLYLQNPAAGQYYSGIGFYDPGGTGSYHGLYLSVNSRLGKNVSILANYTWSHCISDIYDQQTGSGGVSPFNNRRGARSNCAGADRRQVFNASIVAETPRFQRTWVRRAASGWQLAPIVTIRSAQFFSIVPGTDRALTTEPAQTVNLARPDGIYPANQSVNQWINPAAFSLPDLGTYGNLGLNNLKGPGSVQINLALSRNFTVREGWSFQLRGEAFNLPNHLNAAVPVNSMASSTFGQILSDVSGNNGLNPGNQRILQIVAKFVF